jgi:hypothetical protein
MCDASDYAMGAVLGQTKDKKHHAFAEASKTLTGPQLNYATTEKELVAFVYAIDKFRSYLVLTVKIRQPSHEFTFGVDMSFIPYPLVLTPVV